MDEITKDFQNILLKKLEGIEIDIKELKNEIISRNERIIMLETNLTHETESRKTANINIEDKIREVKALTFKLIFSMGSASLIAIVLVKLLWK